MKPTALILAAAFATGISMMASTPAQAVDCMKYAGEMTHMDGIARARKCVGWNSHSRFQEHLNYCLKDPRRADGALARWNRRMGGCMQNNRMTRV